MSNNLGVIKENICIKFEKINEEKLNSISEFIKNNGQYQKIDNYFAFRLFNSVSQREEVFIGNVLFNDYISKLLLRTYEVKDKYYGQMELVYNDLENFYYVVKEDDFSLEELEADFKDFFTEHLEELFFSDEDLEKGIYGDFENLMLGQGSNYISLPLTILPGFFERRFKKKFVENLDSFSNQEQISMMALYWCANGSEMQSYDKFFSKELLNPKIDIDSVKHILKDSERDKINEIRKINSYLSKQEELISFMKGLYLIYVQYEKKFNNLDSELLSNKYLKNNIDKLPSVSNTILNKIIKSNNLLISNRFLEFFKEVKKLKNKMKAKKYNFLKNETEKILQDVENNITELKEIPSFNKAQNLNSYNFEGFDNFKEQLINSKNISYQKEKFLDLDKKEYISEILSSLEIASKSNKKYDKNNKCYICYKNERKVISKNLLTGGKEKKFTNDNYNDNKNICVKCSVYIWLKLKYLGTYYSGNVFPEKRNIVFFYGNIPEERVNQIQGVLNSLYYCTQNPSVYTYEMIDESIEELEKDNLEEQNSKVDDLLKELIESDQKNEREKPAKVPPTIWSWYKNGQQDNKVNTHIFSVGQGENKLYTFVLPYALGRSDEVQKKFSQNRVAVYSMFSFLSRLTGVNGMFYYLSTPKLTDEFTEENIFYYKDKPKKGSLKEYEILTEVAWQLVNPNNVSGRTYSDRLKNVFEKRLKLAKKLNKLPLITISKVYRELISKNNSNYKNLSSIKNEGIINLLPLIKISNNIRKFKNDKEGIKFMGKEIQTEEFEQFVYQFFGELLLIDGVFPQGFGAKPTEFEKYPRLFIKNILKTNMKEDKEKKDVLAGFRIWSNKMLHSRNDFYRGKEFITERMFEIKKLLVNDKYKDILSDKNNLIYFKRSLFGWLSEFLYPIYSIKKKIDLNKSSDKDKIRAAVEEKIESPTPEVEKIISYIKTSKNADIILEYAKKYLSNKFYSKKDGEDE